MGHTAGLGTGAENLAPTGIRSPDRPACSESLYRLSYSGPPPRLVQKTNICHLSMSVMPWELVHLCLYRSPIRLPPTVGEEGHSRHLQSDLLPCRASFTYGRYAASAVRHFLSAHLTHNLADWLIQGRI